jgi:hypothetical protein
VNGAGPLSTTANVSSVSVDAPHLAERSANASTLEVSESDSRGAVRIWRLAGVGLLADPLLWLENDSQARGT